MVSPSEFPTFCGEWQDSSSGTLTVRESVELCTTFSALGCVMAWWVIRAAETSEVLGITQQFLGCWLLRRAPKDKVSSSRSRGGTFPLREGELEEFIQVMKTCSLKEATADDAVRRWRQDAWTFLCFVGLNSLHGSVPRPAVGRWTRVEKRAAASVRRAVWSRCQKDTETVPCSVEAWKKDMSSRLVGYGGEEIGTCEVLTLEQVLPALPLAEHGGSVDALDWVGPRTSFFLQNPKELLKPPKDVSLPRLPGRVHIKPEDRIGIATELVKRNVCEWFPLEKVHCVDGVPILNGLFGVVKPVHLQDGRPILRLIMNLVPSNATQFQLEGGCDGLPNITSWHVVENNETLSCYQSDMASAFYLFKLPRSWLPYLAFNLLAQGEEINGVVGQRYALACKVIPMGWQSSVSIMQEISENLMKRNNISPLHQVCRGKVLPIWFSEVLQKARHEDTYWWHVYLDNFAAAERVVPSDATQAAHLCHEAAEKAWSDAGVVSSKKKRVSGEQQIIELGAEIDGEGRQLGISTSKLLRLMQATLWLLEQKYLNRKHVQILAGRWVFALQFRRPAMSVLDQTWQFIGGKQPYGAKLREDVRREMSSLVFLAPLLYCNLGATVSEWVMASDASEQGGAVGISRTLTPAGKDFTLASRNQEVAGTGDRCPILVLSLFNGIGGAFRAYDVAGILPAVRIAVEMDEGANRITSRRWPGTLIIKDVHLVTREMVAEWSRKYLGILEVHLWAGFPCTDLSKVKFQRENLEGASSKLFYEVPRISKLLREEFMDTVIVKEVVENVASMDEQAANTISEELGQVPYLVDCVDAVPMRRRRFAGAQRNLRARSQIS